MSRWPLEPSSRIRRESNTAWREYGVCKKMDAGEPRLEAAAIAIEHQAWVRQHGTWPREANSIESEKERKEGLTAT
jgi:hypothetical protein